MYTVTVEEASLQFAEVLRHTRTGEEVLLTENSLPIAKLVPLPLQSDTLSRDEKRDDIAYALGIAVARGDISSDTALLAREAWKEIERSLSFLPPPIVSTVENAQVMLSWDKNEHHLIIEIFPDKSVELFYSNRNTHSPWEYDSTVGASLPIEIVERIKALWEM